VKVTLSGAGNDEEWKTMEILTAIEDGKGDLLNTIETTPTS
jgi:hypothetical protein